MHISNNLLKVIKSIIKSIINLALFIRLITDSLIRLLWSYNKESEIQINRNTKSKSVKESKEMFYSKGENKQ